MPNESEPYGAQLVAELKARWRLDLLTNRFGYQPIQALKQADRAATVKLFQGSSYPVIQLLKTKEPAEVAEALVAAQQDDGAAAAMIVMMSIIQ
jgi:hypothetical protein